MNLRHALLSSALLLTTFATANAQTLPSSDFEDGQGTWITFGETVQAFVESEPASVHGGKQSLGFTYQVGGQNLGALVLPTPPGALNEMKSLRFWVKADAGSPFAVALQEREGGRYVSTFYAPKEWQEVALSPDDFSLARDDSDPNDPNGKLDLNLVEGVGIIDLSQLVAQGDARIAQTLFGLKTGARTFYIDDFSVSDKALPARKDDLLDDFSRPQLAWLPFKGVSARHTDDDVLKGRALQAEFTPAPGAFGGFLKQLSGSAFKDAKGLSMRMASAQPTTLILQLEERGGGKYNATVPLTGNITPQEVTLPFADFKPADDSKDDNGQLDANDVKQLFVLDLGAHTGQNTAQGAGEQILWLNQLKVAK